jgi:hypothetical protein
VASHFGEVAGFRKKTYVEAVTGERLNKRRARPVLYRGESQGVPFIQPTLA